MLCEPGICHRFACLGKEKTERCSTVFGTGVVFWPVANYRNGECCWVVHIISSYNIDWGQEKSTFCWPTLTRISHLHVANWMAEFWLVCHFIDGWFAEVVPHIRPAWLMSDCKCQRKKPIKLGLFRMLSCNPSKIQTTMDDNCKSPQTSSSEYFSLEN